MNEYMLLLSAITLGCSAIAYSSPTIATLISYVKNGDILAIVRMAAGGLISLSILYAASTGFHLALCEVISETTVKIVIALLSTLLIVYGFIMSDVFGISLFRAPIKPPYTPLEGKPLGSPTILGFITYLKPTVPTTIALLISMIVFDAIKAIFFFTMLYLGETLASVLLTLVGARTVKGINDFKSFIDKAKNHASYLIIASGFISMLSVISL